MTKSITALAKVVLRPNGQAETKKAFLCSFGRAVQVDSSLASPDLIKIVTQTALEDRFRGVREDAFWVLRMIIRERPDLVDQSMTDSLAKRADVSEEAREALDRIKERRPELILPAEPLTPVGKPPVCSAPVAEPQ